MVNLSPVVLVQHACDSRFVKDRGVKVTRTHKPFDEVTEAWVLSYSQCQVFAGSSLNLIPVGGSDFSNQPCPGPNSQSKTFVHEIFPDSAAQSQVVV